MQNLPIPTLTHSSMFYSRQLWVYNFGIHNATSHSASTYMWDETVASRGADEICSCLQTYIDTLPTNIQQLTCYSDSCFGQNKNFHDLFLEPSNRKTCRANRPQILSTWSYLLAK